MSFPIIPDYYSYLNVAVDATEDEIEQGIEEKCNHILDTVDKNVRSIYFGNLESAMENFSSKEDRGVYDLLFESLHYSRDFKPKPLLEDNERLENEPPNPTVLFNVPLYATDAQIVESANHIIGSALQKNKDPDIIHTYFNALHELQNPKKRLDGLLKHHIREVSQKRYHRALDNALQSNKNHGVVRALGLKPDYGDLDLLDCFITSMKSIEFLHEKVYDQRKIELLAYTSVLAKDALKNVYME